MKHLKQFNNDSEYNSFKNSSEYVEPNVSFVKNTPEVKFNRRDPILTFRAVEANSTIALVKNDSSINISLQYSTNDGSTWNTYTIGNTITLTNIGDNVKFKGINSTFSSSINDYYKFQMSGKIAASGDVTSLLNGVGGDVNLTGKNYCFYYMFLGCNSLITAPELPSTTLGPYCYSKMFISCNSLVTAPKLPATTLAYGCYSGMFYDCTSLITAPKLPATRLTEYCYWRMFYGCYSLITAPKLPAIKLAESCYASMFQDCASLVTAPELPAKILVSNCYYYMFYNCSNLNYIKALFISTPTDAYTQNWVSGVAATGTFVKNSVATWSNTFGPNTIPTGWSVETYKPNELIIYVDEFPENDPQWYDVLGDFNTMEEYLDVYLNNLKGGRANKYDLIPETFSYDGNTYYVWEQDGDFGTPSRDTQYVITDTKDFATLYNRSIESDYENYTNKFIILLRDDMNVYREGCDALIKIERN